MLNPEKGKRGGKARARDQTAVLTRIDPDDGVGRWELAVPA